MKKYSRYLSVFSICFLLSGCFYSTIPQSEYVISTNKILSNHSIENIHIPIKLSNEQVNLICLAINDSSINKKTLTGVEMQNYADKYSSLVVVASTSDKQTLRFEKPNIYLIWKDKSLFNESDAEFSICPYLNPKKINFENNSRVYQIEILTDKDIKVEGIYFTKSP